MLAPPLAAAASVSPFHRKERVQWGRGRDPDFGVLHSCMMDETLGGRAKVRREVWMLMERRSKKDEGKFGREGK